MQSNVNDTTQNVYIYKVHIKLADYTLAYYLFSISVESSNDLRELYCHIII